MADEEIKNIIMAEVMRMLARMMDLMEKQEALYGGVKPLPDPYLMATIALQEKIFENPKTAMIFSETVQNLLKETGIELKDDETFACAIYVVKKPTYISEVVDPTPVSFVPLMMTSDSPVWPRMPGVKPSVHRPIRYIREPAIMQHVRKRTEQDKIKYQTKEKK